MTIPTELVKKYPYLQDPQSPFFFQVTDQSLFGKPTSTVFQRLKGTFAVPISSPEELQKLTGAKTPEEGFKNVVPLTFGDIAGFNLRPAEAGEGGTYFQPGTDIGNAPIPSLTNISREVSPDILQKQNETKSIETQPQEKITPEEAQKRIQEVFGSQWQPSPIFNEKGLVNQGILGAVRIEGRPEVFTLGPGGMRETPESFQQKFGTSNQEGIVGVVSPQQAQRLGIIPPTGEFRPQSVGEGLATKLPGAFGAPTEIQKQELSDKASSLFGKYNITTPSSEETETTSPIKFFQDIYKQVYDSFGISSVKDQITILTKDLEKLDNEFIEKKFEINENPWLTETQRKAKISKEQEKQEEKRNALVNRLSLYNGMVEEAREEARFVASNGLNAYYKEQDYQKDLIFAAMDRAENMAQLEAKQEYQQDILDIRERTLGATQSQRDIQNQLALERLEATQNQRDIQNQLAEQRMNIAYQNAQNANERNTILNELRRLNIAEQTNVSEGQIVIASTNTKAKTTQTETEMLTRTQQSKEYYIPTLQNMLKDVETGAIKGTLNKYTAKIPLVQYFRNEDLSMFNAMASYLSQQIVYMNSGKQINVAEMKSLQESLPNVELTVSENKARLKQFLEISNQSFNRYLKLKGWKVYQGEIPSAPSGGGIDVSDLFDVPIKF